MTRYRCRRTPASAWAARQWQPGDGIGEHRDTSRQAITHIYMELWEGARFIFITQRASHTFVTPAIYDGGPSLLFTPTPPASSRVNHGSHQRRRRPTPSPIRPARRSSAAARWFSSPATGLDEATTARRSYSSRPATVARRWHQQAHRAIGT